MNLLTSNIPQYYKDIVGNKTQFSKLKILLELDKFGTYILYGKSGSGRSSFCDIFQREKKLPVIKYNIENKLIPNLFKKSFVKKIIIIDNITHETSDKKIKDLVSIIEKENKNNYVFIITTHKFKSFNSNKFNIINLKTLKPEEIEMYLLKILDSNGIKYSDKSIVKIIRPLIKNYNNNIREILQNLDIIVKNKKTLKYSEENKNFINRNKKDIVYKNIFDIMDNVFKPKDTYRDHEDLYYSDPFIIENYTYENAYKYIKPENIVNVSESFSNGDIIDSISGVNFDIKQYICPLKYIKPTILSKYKSSRIMFPSCVGKNKKINNSDLFKDMRNKNNDYFNYKLDDEYYINIVNNNPIVSKNIKKEIPIAKTKSIKINDEKKSNKDKTLKKSIDKDKTLKKTIDKDKTLKKTIDKDTILSEREYKKMKVIELRKIAEDKNINIKITGKNGKKKYMLKNDIIKLLLNS